MQLCVSGIKAVDDATIDIEPGKIVLLGGPNGAGKSTMLFAAQAVLGAVPVPTGIKSKTQFGEKIILRGRKEGVIKLVSRGGTRMVEYPRCEVRTVEGANIPMVNGWALGIIKLRGMSEKDRAKELMTITGSTITRERLKKELEKVGLPEAVKEDIIVKALTTSFESAAEYLADKAKEKKGMFRGVTKINWGASQGETFRPEGWTGDLEGKTLDELKEHKDNLAKQLEEVIAANALWQQQQTFAGKSKEFGMEIQNKTTALGEYEANIEKYTALVQELKRRVELITCSGCGLRGVIEDGKLINAADQTESKEDLATVVKQLNDAQTLHKNATYALALAKQNFDKATEAEEHLSNVTQPDLNGARVALGAAQAKAEAKKARDDGLHIHYQIVEYLKAAEIVSPSGLPKAALLEALRYVNASMKKLCEFAGWHQVEIRDDLELYYDGIEYWLLSASEKYRCDATLQITIARITEQPLVILDEMEDLDGPGRGQLINALAASKIASLVACVSYINRNGEKEIPDLKAHDLGVTYWVEKGKVTKL